MKLGFVTPWYGPDIPGGAEAGLRQLTGKLHEHGIEVEVLTTCLRDFYSDWSHDEYRPGLYRVADIPVRRFPVRPRNTERFDAVNTRLLAGEWISTLEERLYFEESVRSDSLDKYLSLHKHEYLFVFLPYLFGTTITGAREVADRAVLIPCMHDEPFARLEGVGELLSSVKGVIFRTEAERKIAERIHGPVPNARVLGEGVDANLKGDPERFNKKYCVTDYIIYAGRKLEGKNVPQLIRYFCLYKKLFGGPLKLVLVGSGQISIPSGPLGFESEIIDLGFIPLQDKQDGISGALALIQPSLNESFSLVLMEAWALGTPVIVHKNCEVTREHCLEGQAGLYFSCFEEFAGVLELLRTDSKLRSRLAENGRHYIERKFAWPNVLEQYLNAFKEWGLET